MDDHRKKESLPGDAKRKQAMAARLRAVREHFGLRQMDLERFSPELALVRVRQWEIPRLVQSKPRLSGLVVLSRLFGYPYEYWWPPLPSEPYSRIRPETIQDEIIRLTEKLRDGKLSPEEMETYRELLELAQRMVEHPTEATMIGRPPLHLVCVLDELPRSAQDLPGPLDPWWGAWVLHVPGVGPDVQVYAYQLDIDSELPAGTWVLFTPRYDGTPAQGRWVFGNRNGHPYVGRRPPEDRNFKLIGAVHLAMYEPEL